MAKGKYARKRLLKQLRTLPINESGLSEWIIKALTKAEINKWRICLLAVKKN